MYNSQLQLVLVYKSLFLLDPHSTHSLSIHTKQNTPYGDEIQIGSWKNRRL